MIQTVSLTPPQRRAWKAISRSQTVCLPWGRGVGKSWFIRLCWYLLVAQWDGKLRPGATIPGVRIVLLMPTLEQAKKVHARLMIDELEGQWAFLGAKINRSEWRVDFPGGSWIQFVTAERAAHIRGLRADVVCIDECDDVDVDIVDAIVGPWLSEPHSLQIVLAAGTPTRGRHGLLYKKHRMGVDRENSHHSFHATYLDVPEFVDVARVERDRPFITPALFAREWLCDFDAAEGLVYPMFKESFHVRKPHKDMRWSEVIIGVDHGYEDAGVFLAIGVVGSGREAMCHVLKETYKQHQIESWWLEEAQEYRRLFPSAKWYADPSKPSMIEAIRRLGAHIVGAENTIEEGASAVADKFHVRDTGGGEFSRLYLDPSCKNTIRELGLYRRKRDPRNKERVLDDIEDKNNHAMDALRYAIFSRFGKPLATRIEVA